MPPKDGSRSTMDGHRTTCESQWYNALDNGSERRSSQTLASACEVASRSSAGEWTVAGSGSHSSTSVRVFRSRDDFDEGNTCDCEACRESACQTATSSFAPNMNTTLNNSMGGNPFQPRRGDLKQFVRRSRSRKVINAPQCEHRVGRTRPSTLRRPVAGDYLSAGVTYRQQGGTRSSTRRPLLTRGDICTDAAYRQQGEPRSSTRRPHLTRGDMSKDVTYRQQDGARSSIRRPPVISEDTSEEFTYREPLKTVASKHTQVPWPTCNNNASTDSMIHIDQGVSNKKRPTRTRRKGGPNSKASATKRRRSVSGRKKANSKKKQPDDSPVRSVTPAKNKHNMLETNTDSVDQSVTNSRRYAKRTPKHQSCPPLCPQHTPPSPPHPTECSPRPCPSQHCCTYVPSTQFWPHHCYSPGSCRNQGECMSTTAISRTASETTDDSVDSFPGGGTHLSKRRKTKADADSCVVDPGEGLSRLIPASSRVGLSPQSKVRIRSCCRHLFCPNRFKCLAWSPEEVPSRKRNNTLLFF